MIAPSNPIPCQPSQHRDEPDYRPPLWVQYLSFVDAVQYRSMFFVTFFSYIPRLSVASYLFPWATASPWTITHRPFENNVHKVTYAALPLLVLLRLADPGLFGVALGVAFLFGSLMSNVSKQF